jgi:CheY-like chemotaxis protein
MKILIVDDEQSFAALLGRTVKRLGHKAVLAAHPGDALELLSYEIDAVITDIDMPVMTGIELAHRIRSLRHDVPIAFCTGSDPHGTSIDAAAAIGRVLPKVWTVADIKGVIEEFELTRQARQRASRAKRASQPPVDAPATARPAALGTMPDASAPAPGFQRPRVAPAPAAEWTAPPPPPVARPARKVRVVVRTWEQLSALCERGLTGPVHFTVRGPHDIDPGDPIAVSLALPDEISVAVGGAVEAVRPEAGGSSQEIVIALVGLTAELAARLQSLVAVPVPLARPRRGSAPPPPGDLARGSERGMKVSDLLRDNARMKDELMIGREPQEAPELLGAEEGDIE